MSFVSFLFSASAFLAEDLSGLFEWVADAIPH